nr:glycosyltransferase [Microbacterium testaceum]
MRKRLDFVELGGRGGVYQHTVAVAEAVSSVGAVRILTADDPEVESREVRSIHVFSWHRERRLRSFWIVLGFYVRTVPRLLTSSARVVWVQGTFKPLMTLTLICALRMTRRTVLFSPHNLFSRRGNATEERLISACVRASSLPVVYNDADHARVRSINTRVLLLPLVQYVPPIPSDVRAKWETIASGAPRTVLFAGQLRRDKNLDLAMAACALAGAKLIVLGPDTDGIFEEMRRRQPAELDAHWEVGYADLEEICAAITCADLVLCPYSVVAQSGVASLARALGTPVAGSSLGGLESQSDIELRDLTPSAIAAAIGSMDAGRPEDLANNTQVYLRAIGGLL